MNDGDGWMMNDEWSWLMMRSLNSKTLTRQLFTHGRLYTHKFLHWKPFNRKAFTQSCLYTEALHSDACAQSSFCAKKNPTHKLLTHWGQTSFSHASFYTQKVLHTEVLLTNPYIQRPLHRAVFVKKRSYTQTFYTQKLLHTNAFTHKAVYTEKLSPKNAFHTRKLLHAEVFAQTPLDTEVFTLGRLSTEQLFTRSIYTETLSHRSLYSKMLYT